MIKLKRVYEEPSHADGFKVLVERFWPRGFTKERASIRLWLKDVAPSTELRKWFGHDPKRWEGFRQRYLAELKEERDSIDLPKQKTREGAVTLVYAAKDEEHNGALVLKGTGIGDDHRYAGPCPHQSPCGRRGYPNRGVAGQWRTLFCQAGGHGSENGSGGDPDFGEGASSPC